MQRSWHISSRMEAASRPSYTDPSVTHKLEWPWTSNDVCFNDQPLDLH